MLNWCLGKITGGGDGETVACLNKQEDAGWNGVTRPVLDGISAYGSLIWGVVSRVNPCLMKVWKTWGMTR